MEIKDLSIEKHPDQMDADMIKNIPDLAVEKFGPNSLLISFSNVSDKYFRMNRLNTQKGSAGELPVR